MSVPSAAAYNMLVLVQHVSFVVRRRKRRFSQRFKIVTVMLKAFALSTNSCPPMYHSPELIMFLVPPRTAFKRQYTKVSRCSGSMTARPSRRLAALAVVCGCCRNVHAFVQNAAVTAATQTTHTNGGVVISPVPRCRHTTHLATEVLSKEGSEAPGAVVHQERKEKPFEQWAQQAGIKAQKLRHGVFSDPIFGDLRGLRAVEATAAKEQLVSVPAKAAVTLTASESTPFKSWVSSEFWDNQRWYVKLALKLLWERQLGSASAVDGYVRVLPRQGSFDTLVHWTDEELDMLQYPKCINSAKRQRKAWDKLHETLVASCPDGAGRVVSKEDLVWAMECVLSRAFSGRFGGGQNSALLSGGLAAAAAAAYAVTEQPLWVLLAAVALLPLTLPELGAFGTAVTGIASDKAGDYVLVPFVDSMNHVTTATTELSFSPVSGDLEVSVIRGYSEGEQAYISYGLKSNDELLQFYGFVEADCPADTYVIEDIAAKIGVEGDQLSGVGDANARALVCEGVVISRGSEVVSKETLEGLRLLLQSGQAGGDGLVWHALRNVCEKELASVRPNSIDGNTDGASVRERLAFAFGREKASVLEEAMRSLEKKGPL